MAELARFLFQKGHFSRDNNAVRPGAFLPQNGQTSVFDIVGLATHETAALGDAIGQQRGKPPKGRGEFDYRHVTEVGLQFDRDDTPPRHGNLIGWPSEGPELKARWKAIAADLAVRATLVLREQRQASDDA
jgi:hypothetical protein